LPTECTDAKVRRLTILICGGENEENPLFRAIRWFLLLNDLAPTAPSSRIEADSAHGGESFRHARLTRTLGLPVHRLPSTSPANASWSFERKLVAWREVVGLAGLL